MSSSSCHSLVRSSPSSPATSSTSPPARTPIDNAVCDFALQFFNQHKAKLLPIQAATKKIEDEVANQQTLLVQLSKKLAAQSEVHRASQVNEAARKALLQNLSSVHKAGVEALHSCKQDAAISKEVSCGNQAFQRAVELAQRAAENADQLVQTSATNVKAAQEEKANIEGLLAKLQNDKRAEEEKAKNFLVKLDQLPQLEECILIFQRIIHMQPHLRLFFSEPGRQLCLRIWDHELKERKSDFDQAENALNKIAKDTAEFAQQLKTDISQLEAAKQQKASAAEIAAKVNESSVKVQRAYAQYDLNPTDPQAIQDAQESVEYHSKACGAAEDLPKIEAQIASLEERLRQLKEKMEAAASKELESTQIKTTYEKISTAKVYIAQFCSRASSSGSARVPSPDQQNVSSSSSSSSSSSIASNSHVNKQQAEKDAHAKAFDNPPRAPAGLYTCAEVDSFLKSDADDERAKEFLCKDRGQGWNLIALMIASGEFDRVTKVLEQNSRLVADNAKTYTIGGFNLLQLLCFQASMNRDGVVKIIKSLKEMKIGLNRPRDRSPLHIARHLGYHYIVSALVHMGAKSI